MPSGAFPNLSTLHGDCAWRAAASVPTLRPRKQNAFGSGCERRSTFWVSLQSAHHAIPEHLCPTALPSSSLFVWQPNTDVQTSTSARHIFVLWVQVSSTHKRDHRTWQQRAQTDRAWPRPERNRTRAVHLCPTRQCQRQRRKKGPSGPAQPSRNLTASTNSRDCQFRQSFVANLFVLPAQRSEKLRLKCHQEQCVCRDVSPIHRSMEPVMLCFSVMRSGALSFSSSPSPPPRLITCLVAAPPVEQIGQPLAEK